MSTRSTISLKTSNNRYKTIYCHFDGYPDHVGKILAEHYDTLEKVQELIDLGDLSVLGKNVKPQEGQTHTRTQPAPETTIAYHRDYKENLYTTQAMLNESVKDINYEQYNYVFADGEWMFFVGADWDNFTPLTKEVSI